MAGALINEGKPRRRRPNESRSVHLLEGDEPAIGGVLPNRELGTRRAPGVHHVFIGSVALCQPVEKIENQSFLYGIRGRRCKAHNALILSHNTCHQCAAAAGRSRVLWYWS